MRQLLAVGLLMLAACSGIEVREKVQMPAMAEAYERVLSPLIERGIVESAVANKAAARLESEAFLEALKSGDRTKVVGWQKLRPLCVAGIAAAQIAKEIGPGVAQSFSETLARFDANLVTLLRR